MGSEDSFEECAFSATARPDDRYDLAGQNLEIDFV
jgi:hypothetical protein